MSKILKVSDLFDTGHTIAKKLFYRVEYPHLILPKIKDFIIEISKGLGSSFLEVRRGVFIAEDATVSESATIMGPTIIGHGAEIRPGAYIRGSAIIGDGAVIGNSTEVKNSIIFDEAKLPHYNYAGDSIIGYRAHMGAGVIASNLRLDKAEIKLYSEEERLRTGLTKMGVMLGDYAEVGCGSVLCPGSVVGRESLIYPLVSVNGTIPEGCIYDGKEIREKERRTNK